MFRLFECCALSFFERFVLSFSLKIERFVSDSAEIWICGLYMYLLMFSGAIYLRYNMKKAPRPFRIGSKGNGLMWLIGGLGFCGSLLAFVLSFIPPSQIAVGSNTVWFAVLIIGCIVVVAAPFIIYASRKPSWVDKDTQFEPFHWEEQATTAQTAAPVSGAAKSSASSASTNAAAGPASQSTPSPEQHK